VRIGLSGLLALRLATTDYRAVAAQPVVLFRPVWYLGLLERMPSQSFVAGLQICGIVAALVAASGLAVRASLSSALVCSLILDGMLNSAGRVIVGDAVLTLCLLVLLACGNAASDGWAVRAPLRRIQAEPGRDMPLHAGPTPRGARYGWPIRTAMVTIALSVFFAGLQKLRYSGLAWVTSDNLRWILYASSDGSLHPNGMALFIADRPWLSHLCAAGTLLLEIGFPLVLVSTRARWLFIPGLVAMHEVIRLAIGLDYSMQGLTLLVVFVDWPGVVSWLRRRSQPPSTAARTLDSGSAGSGDEAEDARSYSRRNE